LAIASGVLAPTRRLEAPKKKKAKAKASPKSKTTAAKKQKRKSENVAAPKEEDGEVEEKKPAAKKRKARAPKASPSVESLALLQDDARTSKPAAKKRRAAAAAKSVGSYVITCDGCGVDCTEQSWHVEESNQDYCEACLAKRGKKGIEQSHGISII
jgi:hypothetical protein